VTRKGPSTLAQHVGRKSQRRCDSQCRQAFTRHESWIRA